MTDEILTQVQETHARYAHLEEIARKLLEQLRGEKVSFSDAETIVSILSASLKQERDERTL